MRYEHCTIALGTTIHSLWSGTIEGQIKHAKDVGVDFIQIRPELLESSRGNGDGNKDWERIRDTVEKLKPQYERDNFGVIYTDSERAYQDHDYNTCYAMYLVPTLIPAKEDGRIIILPCSYARNKVGNVPILGVMSEETTLSNFWKTLNIKMGLDISQGEEAEDVLYVRNQPINPKMGCPQCRFYMLNKRISAIINNKNKLPLITKLVKALEGNVLNSELEDKVKAAWKPWVVDTEKAKEAFEISKKLGIRPSL
jgi:hypothetical protein